MIGIKFPFSFSGGSVAATSDPAEIIGSRVAFCLGTQVGERVMAPDWGIDIMNSAYALGADVAGILREAVEDAFRYWFPGYELHGLEVKPDLSDPTRLSVLVRYGMYGSSMDAAVRVGTQMPDGAEIFDRERAY